MVHDTVASISSAAMSMNFATLQLLNYEQHILLKSALFTQDIYAFFLSIDSKVNDGQINACKYIVNPLCNMIIIYQNTHKKTLHNSPSRMNFRMSFVSSQTST